MRELLITCILFSICILPVKPQEKIFPGADESTPSLAQYFSWVNNNNEGATEEHTKINLDFFAWLQKEYGMQLDIYAFDAGAIDGKRFYGSIHSDRFKKQFPNGFDPVYKQAKSQGIRLGIWGGPDGFGDSPEEERARIDQMVKLCRDYEFALFKFDAVCGPLRPEKEDAFIEMMQLSRKYSPDLILLNHRLGLNKALPYATTFLMGGDETYIDVHMTNSMTASHHRAQALARELSPCLQRLTEDCGVCLSSCLDYWDDDLVLQAFNRSMILAPQIYGNPWFLRDDEYPKLARIFNLHRKYGDILVNGMVLPESYGLNAVSRGDNETRFITLRNISWDPEKFVVRLDEEIGLDSEGEITLVQLHPTEKIIGSFKKGDNIEIEVQPFRSCLFMASTNKYDEPAIEGADYRVLKNVDGKPVEIEILGMPGTQSTVKLRDAGLYRSARLNRKDAKVLTKGEKTDLALPGLIMGEKLTITFPGELLEKKVHRKLGYFLETQIPEDSEALYEATVFTADNNALEVRSLQRSGETSIPEVQAARDAFFNQDTFTGHGIWDRNLFDGDLSTGFWKTVRYRTGSGCLRLDLGEEVKLDELIIRVPDKFSLLPLLPDEGNIVEVSNDLVNWEEITYLADLEIQIPINREVRYLRFRSFPQQIVEIEGISDGEKVDRSQWKASNLFEHPRNKKALKAWKTNVTLDELPEGSYLCVALKGKHGADGAYAAARIDGELFGSPDRAPSYLSNPWESFNSRKDKNYTIYFPLDEKHIGKTIELWVFGYDKENLDFEPELWISAYPYPWEKIMLTLEKKSDN